MNIVFVEYDPSRTEPHAVECRSGQKTANIWMPYYGDNIRSVA